MNLGNFAKKQIYKLILFNLSNKTTKMKEQKLVCVLCGKEWIPEVKNRCECGGFCTWGYKKGGKMLSRNIKNKD